MESTQEQHLKTSRVFLLEACERKCKTINFFIQTIVIAKYIVILPVLFHSWNGVAVLTHEFTL